MKNNPLISIIVPAYNSEKYISETIENLLNQTWKNREIIVINDGSKDNTLKILKKYQKEKKIRLINSKNKGACYARNLGIKKAKGDYFQFIDSDDLMDFDKIEKQLDYSNFSNESVIGCDWIQFSGNFKDKKILKFRADKELRKDLSSISWLATAWSNNFMFPPNCWLIPKEILEKTGLWDERLHQNQDGEFFARILLNSKKVLFCPGTKVYYRSCVEGSISSLREKKHFKSLYLSYLSYTKNITKFDNSYRTRKACALNFQRLIYKTYPKYKDIVKNSEKEIKKLKVDLRFKDSPIFNILTKLFGLRFALFFEYLFYNKVYYRKFK